LSGQRNQWPPILPRPTLGSIFDIILGHAFYFRILETTTFNPKRTIAGFAAGHARLVERFTRTNRDTLDYRFTVDDPAMWTKPWTALVPAERTDVEIDEFACHEGTTDCRTS